ncbi:patatin-like phospholipase family protein [filamentous cyanobacterium LEGE 11480]|uniref:Patatin-like phospholipase family protein n=1 Tax=Romeriopsis navalis LEGE 11480 TaxID=2777977 RepID=A0A928VQQ8_9CYAN|nr:patatin-like phospholipase family protein [Romeriopsis navalis]MBE9030374.1 patatin-like phospholipase family protein [Romeriopsis navalis LEGE 11480]
MRQNLKSRIWVSQGDNTYNFPEQAIDEVNQKPPIGVCFSGGGTRAMTAAMGQLRALEHLGVIPKIRYISCVSGGSWASSIYTYYRAGAKNDAELLGPVTPAEKITDEHVVNGLKQTQLAYGATKSLNKVIPCSWELPKGWICKTIMKKWKYSSHDVWNYAIGQTYLEPYGLFNSDIAKDRPDELPYFSYDATTVDEIKACNPKLQAKEFLTVRPGRPYLIMNACVLLRPKYHFLFPNAKDIQADLINFEYTPLTVGRPHLKTFQNRFYGGGFIEPFAYGGGVPVAAPLSPPCAESARKLNSAGWVDIPSPSRHYSLTETTGTSSSAFAESFLHYDVTRFNPKDFYWAVKGNGPYCGHKTLFGDGGLLENNGLIPLIQRGVKLAIVFINAATKLDPTYCPNDDQHDDRNNPNGKCDATLPALFGYSNPKWEWYYPHNQVFPSNEFRLVLDALNQKRERNEPMIVTCQHTICENTDWGVNARQEPMLVTWCYLDRYSKWEAQLGSSKIRKQIKQGNKKYIPACMKGPYLDFPNYKTIGQDGDFDLVKLTKEQITLLADFTCDAILMDEEQAILTAIQQVG